MCVQNVIKRTHRIVDAVNFFGYSGPWLERTLAIVDLFGYIGPWLQRTAIVVDRGRPEMEPPEILKETPPGNIKEKTL